MKKLRRSEQKPVDDAQATRASFAPTPIYITPRVRFILIVATFVIVYLLAVAAPGIPRLLMLGATLALILSFPVRMLNRWLPRGWAIAIAVGSTLLLVILLLLLIVPFTISEVSDIIQDLPELAADAQELTRDAIREMTERGWIRQDPEETYDTVESTLLNRGEALLESALGTALTSLTQSINVLQETADSAANTDENAPPRFESIPGLEAARSVKALLQDKRVLYVSASRAQEQEPIDVNGDGVIDDQDEQPAQVIDSVIVVIAGSAQDAEVITFAQSNVSEVGSLTAIVRHAEDDEIEDTLGITIDQLVEAYGLRIPSIVEQLNEEGETP